MSLSVLICSPMLAATGNTSTVQRLHSHFIKNNIKCSLLCSHKLLENNLTCTVKSLNRSILQSESNVLLLLHAFKSGSCLICRCENYCKVCIKYGVIFGGTDLNEDIKDEIKVDVMQSCIKSASFCVAFNQVLFEVAKGLFPSAQLHKQVQALDYELYDSYKKCDLDSFAKVNMEPFVFVLPCSIRPVKDPLFMLEKIEKIRQKTKKDVRLLILGPVTDSCYGQLFFDKICALTSQSHSLKKSLFIAKPHSIPLFSDVNNNNICNQLEKWLQNSTAHGIQYLPALAQKELFLFMKKGYFNVVLNTSLSEGMSSTLLEAMTFKVPVLARNITGNQAIIHDRITGLLFSTPDEFVFKAIQLIEDSDLCKKIANAAYSYVFHNHSPYVESKFYISLCETSIDK